MNTAELRAALTLESRLMNDAQGRFYELETRTNDEFLVGELAYIEDALQQLAQRVRRLANYDEQKSGILAQLHASLPGPTAVITKFSKPKEKQ